MPRQQTIRINQGYRIDSTWELLALVGRGVRRLSALLWRWRTELGVGLAVVAVRLLAGRLLVAESRACSHGAAGRCRRWPGRRRGR